MRKRITFLGIIIISTSLITVSAQESSRVKKADHLTLKDIFRDIRVNPFIGVQKMKSNTDNNIDKGISEVFIDTYINSWSEFQKGEYTYLNDRKSILIEYYNKFNSEDWTFNYFTEITLNDNGQALEIYTDYADQIYTQYRFYYNENGRLDSLFSEEIEEESSFITEVRFFEITSDSLRFELTYFSDGAEFNSNNNFAVQRDGNYIEYYHFDDFIDRYTYYDMSLGDLSAVYSDDLFLIEGVNDEYYFSDGFYTPYSRTYFIEEGGIKTKLQTDYYESGNWITEEILSIGYNNEDRINELTHYSEEGNNIFYNERLRFNYEPTVSNELESNDYKIQLNQNYPNPFNPTTKITFELPNSSLVELKVFNMLGKEVATLSNTILSAGTHTVTFNASSLSSGIYYYQLRYEDQVQTKSMMLIK